MKKRNLSLAGRGAVLTVLAASLAAVGISYAAWTDPLHITGKLTTGALDMVFPDDREHYTAAIVAGTDSQAESFSLNCDVKIINDGKAAAVSFKDPLPLNLLSEGGRYLQFSYLLKPGAKNTVTGIKEYQADFSAKPRQTVDFKPLTQLVVLHGQGYNPEDLNLTADYAVPLSFQAYRELERREGELWGKVYLRLTPESVERISGLSQPAALPSSILDKAEPVDLRDAGLQDSGLPSGALVTYEGLIPLTLDQAAANPDNPADFPKE